jgi:hypothetical protein
MVSEFRTPATTPTSPRHEIPRVGDGAATMGRAADAMALRGKSRPALGCGDHWSRSAYGKHSASAAAPRPTAPGSRRCATRMLLGGGPSGRCACRSRRSTATGSTSRKRDARATAEPTARSHRETSNEHSRISVWARVRLTPSPIAITWPCYSDSTHHPARNCARRQARGRGAGWLAPRRGRRQSCAPPVPRVWCRDRRTDRQLDHAPPNRITSSNMATVIHQTPPPGRESSPLVRAAGAASLAPRPRAAT